MKNKYLLVLGRGIEGSGCTKLTIELYNYLKENGYETKVIAGNDKKWGREKAHKNEIVQYNFEHQLDTINKIASDFDRVVLLSVPAKNYTTECQKNFVEFLKNSHDNGKKIIYFQCDHKIHSINRNMYAIPDFFDMFKYIDIIVTHSREGDFINFCKRHDITINNLLASDGNGINGINGMNFDIMKPFWKSFEEKEYRTIKYIGRSAQWKGPYLLRDLHEREFKKNGYITTCEGIELSIGSLQFLFKELKPKRLIRDDTCMVTSKTDIAAFNAGNYKFERNHIIYMLPPYNHDEAMERLSKCQFGTELLVLSDSMSKDVMELAMFEMVAVGCIPIFRKHWGQIYKVDGKSLYDWGFKENGTIFIDEDNPEPAMKLINYLSDHKEDYDKYREIAFNFYKKFFSSNVIFTNLIKLIEEKI